MASRTARFPRRFLPSDPRVEEPYLLTPQLALRVAILGFVALALFAVLFLRLWALQVLSGDKYLRAGERQPRARRCGSTRRAARSSTATAACSSRNVLGHEPRGVAGRPAEEPRRRAQLELQRLSRSSSASRSKQLEQRIREHARRPADAGRDPARHPRRPDLVRRGAPARSSRASSSPTSYLRKYPHQLARRPRARPRRRDQRRRAEGDEAGAATGSATSIGQAGRRGDLRHATSAAATARQQLHGRLARPADEPARADGRTRGRATRCGSRSTSSLQRAAEQALRDGHRARARRAATAGRPTAARSSRSTRATARCSRSRRTRPSSRRSTSAATRASSRRSRTTRSRPRRTIPASNRALDVTYPPGSTWKPVTALAAMQEHILTPYSSLPCTPDYTAYGQIFNNWNPYASRWITLPTALAESCDTYFYRVGHRLLQAAGEPRPPAPELGVALRLRRADRHRRRPRGGRARADAGVALRARSRGPPCTARSTASGSRATRSRWRSARATSTVTPIQMTRFYAMIANGGQLVTPHIVEDVEQPTGDPKAPQVLRRFTRAAADRDRRRPDRALDRPHRPLRGDALADRHLVGRLRLVPGLDLGQDRHRREARHAAGRDAPRSSSTSRGGAATGRPRTREIVVCAVIENGGHGGTAAAPAALKVFQKYFKVTRLHRDHPRVRLMAFEAVDTRARGLRPPARRRGERPRRRRPRARLGGSSARWSRSSRYGLWAIDGITRHDAGELGRPAGALRRGRRRRASSSATLIDPAVYRRFSRADLRHDDRADAARARRRRRHARLAPLDRPRLLPLPAVRVREGAVRARSSPRSSPTARSGSTSCGRRSARSRSPRSRSRSSSSSRTSARRSSTRPCSPPCCSSPACAGCTSR